MISVSLFDVLRTMMFKCLRVFEELDWFVFFLAVKIGFRCFYSLFCFLYIKILFVLLKLRDFKHFKVSLSHIAIVAFLKEFPLRIMFLCTFTNRISVI